MSPNVTVEPSDFSYYYRVLSSYIVGNAGNYTNYGAGLIRPAITLKSDVTISSGNGTLTNPYKIKEATS